MAPSSTPTSASAASSVSLSTIHSNFERELPTPNPTQISPQGAQPPSIPSSSSYSIHPPLIAPPRKSSSNSPVSGLPPSVSHASVSNINRSLSALDVKLAKEVNLEGIRGNVWQQLCVKILPLFNGQGLKGHIEDLNEMVAHWLAETPTPQLTLDLVDLLQTGLYTLGSKLATVPDEQLASRLVEVWSFYFGTVVPYLQGVFLPIRGWKRTVAGMNLNAINAMGGALGSEIPDVRLLSLAVFRDMLIWPLRERLIDIFPPLSQQTLHGQKVNDAASRLMQMLSILNGLPPTTSSLNGFSDDRKLNDVLIYFKECMMGDVETHEGRQSTASRVLLERVHSAGP